MAAISKAAKERKARERFKKENEAPTFSLGQHRTTACGDKTRQDKKEVKRLETLRKNRCQRQSRLPQHLRWSQFLIASMTRKQQTAIYNETCVRVYDNRKENSHERCQRCRRRCNSRICSKEGRGVARHT